MTKPAPRIVVFTTLFPNAGQPSAGLFIRERMFRVAKVLPLTVVAPVPWFPFQGLLRRWRPHFRPEAPRHEVQDGIEVRHPRFLSVPGAFKWLDGVLMALGCFPTMLRLKRDFGFNVIDAHFAYPDGDAGTLLGKWLRVPVTITLRGTEVPLARDPLRRRRMTKALGRASRIFSVSASLKRHAESLGRGKRADPRGGKRRRYGEIPPPAAAGGAQPPGSAGRRAGVGVRWRAGGAQGVSPRDGMSARPAAAVSGLALSGGRGREPRR